MYGGGCEYGYEGRWQDLGNCLAAQPLNSVQQSLTNGF